MNTEIIKIGAEIFIKKGDSILLGKRRNCYGADTWALPGGHLEYGETLIDAAKREMNEELDIAVTKMELLFVTEDIEEQRHYIHFSFLAQEYSGEIHCKEPSFCYEWKFFEITDLPTPLFKPHENIVKKYREKSVF